MFRDGGGGGRRGRSGAVGQYDSARHCACKAATNVETTRRRHRGGPGGARWAIERFSAKWTPVRVKKTRQMKSLEPRSDSIGTEEALGSLRRERNETVCEARCGGPVGDGGRW